MRLIVRSGQRKWSGRGHASTPEVNRGRHRDREIEKERGVDVETDRDSEIEAV